MQRYSLPVTTATRDSMNVADHSTNYSIPLHDASPLPSMDTSRRPIADGDVQARIRQLENEIEQLTLSNIRLLRANRILKLDCDRLVDEETAALRDDIDHLRQQNVHLQRSNRLLQDELDLKTEQMNQMRNDQIRKMKNVGPEYEYLVQIINLLYRQLQGKPTCDKTCCFTNKPLSQGFSVMTLPPETDGEQQQPIPQHICRPSIRSHVSAGSLACAMQHENSQLQLELERVQAERDSLYQHLAEKEEDIETLKHELHTKDNIVTQLEKDFERMELEVIDLQKDWRFSDRFKSESSFSDINAFPIPPPLPKDDLVTMQPRRL